MSHQSGSIYKYRGTSYLKYRTFEGDSSSAKRVHKTLTLCAVNGERHHEQCTSRGEHRSKKSILPLQDALMKPVNDGAGKPADPKAAMLGLQANLETASEAALRWGGAEGLSHSPWKSVADYSRKEVGSQDRDHAKNLMSAIFTYAVNTGVIETNPCHDMKPLIRTIEPADTKAYDLETALAIINLFPAEPNIQCMLSLLYFCGLRIGEVAGLKWEDFSSTQVSIQRAIVRSKECTPKSKSSAAPVPLIAPVLGALQRWNATPGFPKTGWVFLNDNGKPQDLKSIIQRKVVPVVEKADLPWYGTHAFRRGTGTMLTEFSREYSRFFGSAPTKDIAKLRQETRLWA
ncbi:MAG: tyrosine-type recombinase/integrase [Terriglobales bacterium]